MSTTKRTTDDVSEAEKDALLERLADEFEDTDPFVSEAFRLASQVDMEENS